MTGLAAFDGDTALKATLDSIDASAAGIVRSTVAASLEAGYASSRVQEAPDLVPSMGESYVASGDTVQIN